MGSNLSFSYVLCLPYFARRNDVLECCAHVIPLGVWLMPDSKTNKVYGRVMGLGCSPDVSSPLVIVIFNPRDGRT